MTSFQVDAIPTCGRPKSSSVMPTARSIARAAARARPLGHVLAVDLQGRSGRDVRRHSRDRAGGTASHTRQRLRRRSVPAGPPALRRRPCRSPGPGSRASPRRGGTGRPSRPCSEARPLVRVCGEHGVDRRLELGVAEGLEPETSRDLRRLAPSSSIAASTVFDWVADSLPRRLRASRARRTPPGRGPGRSYGRFAASFAARARARRGSAPSSTAASTRSSSPRPTTVASWSAGAGEPSAATSSASRRCRRGAASGRGLRPPPRPRSAGGASGTRSGSVK